MTTTAEQKMITRILEMITQINLRNRSKICGINAKRGQALLELAVFGMVALAALGFLIRVGMQMNYDQEIRMGAFRRALAAAAADNGTNQDAIAVSYYYASDRQMPNPTDGYMSLSRSRSEASGFVEWGDRLTFAYQVPNRPDLGRQTHQHIIVRSNGQEENTLRQDDFPQSDPGAPPGDLAFQGIATKSETTNTGSATVGQTTGGTWLSSSTGTHSTTWVNTKDGGRTVGSDTGGGAGVVNW